VRERERERERDQEYRKEFYKELVTGVHHCFTFYLPGKSKAAV
jgi:hypothetical protein